LNALSLRFRFFEAIEVQERTLGTVYFPLSFAILLALFWPIGHPEIAAGGLMAMTWGDAMASIVGKTYGRRGYTLWGQKKTWLGSLACLSWTFLSVTLTFRLMTELDQLQVLLYAFLAGLVATVVEALSPKGADNIFVPLATAGMLYLLAAM
jgi:phytol kinase